MQQAISFQMYELKGLDGLSMVGWLYWGLMPL